MNDSKSRGRPSLESPLSNAERQRLHRERKKSLVTIDYSEYRDFMDSMQSEYEGYYRSAGNEEKQVCMDLLNVLVSFDIRFKSMLRQTKGVKI